MHKPRKSLYYFGHQSGINVYGEDNGLIGTTTGCAARPNGQPSSIVSIQVRNSSGGDILVGGIWSKYFWHWYKNNETNTSLNKTNTTLTC